MERICSMCGSTEMESDLYEGVYDDEIVLICKECARDENIPVLRKPTPEQLVQPVEERYSVRERMERLSGMRKPSTNQSMIKLNMSKVKKPEPKQSHPNIVDNYYWEINMARRRKKMSINQLSEQIGIPVDILESLERGKIPSEFEIIFEKLERYFDIKLLKRYTKNVNFNYNPNEEQKILEDVKSKLKNKKEQLKKIRKGTFDFSREEEIKNITLEDLARMKREKEKENMRKKVQRQTDDMFGDEIEFE